MKNVLFIFMFLPTLSFAMSAESEYFFGSDGNGTEVLIEFYSDGFPWNGNNFIYRDSKNKNFKYCWNTAEKDQAGLTKFTFQCTSKENTNPTLIYRDMQVYKGIPRVGDMEFTPEYKNALELFNKNKKWIEIWGSPLIIFKCEMGCTKEVPQILFDSTHVGGD